VAVKRGIFVAPFDELYEPRLLAELAGQAEANGFDGFFLWDHVNYRDPVRAVADPWVAMSAIAYATERIRIGPLVTPLSRRRIQKLARETVTLDHLSDGRLVLGVGLGSDRNNELEPFGEVVDPRQRAQMLDDGLKQLTSFWSGGFEPLPLQQPRIPIWVAGRWPKRAPLRRAARFDGFFPIDLESPDQLAQLVKELHELRPGSEHCDVIVTNPPATDPAPWEAAGATWCLTGFERTPHEADVRAAIAAG
jgi:alkanesulfonate monooxygenase SsuD/methylene tetrahydromethanopterin reductase-like flavin-dependent oxidoreductase (luciferase family)